MIVEYTTVIMSRPLIYNQTNNFRVTRLPQKKRTLQNITNEKHVAITSICTVGALFSPVGQPVVVA